ncbi:hypothetical protein MACK_003229 [Theileria orientalis]|uniref:Calmodulin n=1 Tax=Theileria orientalis TaxID=68886 RepID=A0A976SIC5_THEOR|nr:hypothetical protein MACK_003229 [Theileria orientalis]
MDYSTKLRNLFLVMDTKKEGVLSEDMVLMALHSIGFVVPNDVKADLKPMNCHEFVTFGTNLAKKLPSDGGLSDLYKSLCSGKSKTMDTGELKQVMETLKISNPHDVEHLLNVLDPRGVGQFDCESLVNAFKA